MNQGEIVKNKGYDFEFSKSRGIIQFHYSPQSSRGLLGMRASIMGAARNHLGREHHWDWRPRVAALCYAAWFVL